MAKFRQRTKRTRSVATRRKHTRVLIVCGGLVTEPRYFEYVRDELGATGVAVKIASKGCSPMRLLDTAVHAQRADRRIARGAKDDSNVFDAVWMVIDVDEFAKEIQKVLPEAERQGVRVAISNPCFEPWLVWHLTNQSGHTSTGSIQRKAETLGIVAGKTVNLDTLRGRFEHAESRSRTARGRHTANQTARPDDNPSSDVDGIVRYLIDAELKRTSGFSSAL